MALHAFNAGCNIIAFDKGNIRYGMCCAWAQMLDYDRLGMLLGSQSVTGKALAIGDVVGVSGLVEGQEDVARRLGEGHSDRVDKFTAVAHHRVGTAILIDGARTQMVCEVADVMRLPGIAADRFVVLKVRSFEQNETKPFLNAYFE
jgi:flavin reductase (DIM6/NTAB) family NADH-FMN oxidoreductase RutF